VTVAVAILLRIEGPIPHRIEVERWVREIDVAIGPMLGAGESSPVGITIRFTERNDKRIAANLILDAAVACPSYFERSEVERRTVAHFDAPPGAIAN